MATGEGGERSGRDEWDWFKRVLALTLQTIERTPNILPQFIPGLLMEGVTAPWVFQKEEVCHWCGGRSGAYRAGDAAFGPLHFCVACWSLDAFAPDGSRLAHASRRYSKILSALPQGAHVTDLRLRDGAVEDWVWNTDPPDDEKYDCYYAYSRGDYGIAFMEFLRLVETENYSWSFWYLSEMCWKGGAGLPADAATALKWCRLGAELGIPACQCALGWRLQCGNGVEPDLSQALLWYRKAAEQGNREGREHLALLYYFGEGVGKDPTEARRLLTEARGESGDLNPGPAFALGCLCYEGEGGPQDYETARRCFEWAAMLGLDGGHFYLGLMCAAGNGMEQDYAEARSHFLYCASKGNSAAQYKLGQLHRLGQGGPRDLQQAEAWYRKAAEQGYARAHLGLGDLCRDREWAGFSLRMAQREYIRAVEGAELHGYFRLGVLYEREAPPFQNLQRAAGYFRRGAERGEGHCQQYLGWMYEVGRGVRVDWVQAHRLLSRASAQGVQEASERLVALEARMTLAQLQEARERVAS